MMKGCIQLSHRPNINNTVNMVPVDHVARVVVSSTLHPPVTPLGVAQVTGTPRLRFNEFLGCLETWGYPIKQVDYVPWKASLERYVAAGVGDVHALLPLYHFVTADLPSSTKAPELDDANTKKALAADVHESGRPLTETAVSKELIGKYLAYLVKIGFLPPPTHSEKPLPEVHISSEQLDAMKDIGGRGGV